jgi:hypothetical protein
MYQNGLCILSGEKTLGFGVAAYGVRYSLKKIGGLLLFNMPMQKLKNTLYKNTTCCEV